MLHQIPFSNIVQMLVLEYAPNPTKYSPLNAAPTAAIVPNCATTPPAPAV